MPFKRVQMKRYLILAIIGCIYKQGLKIENNELV
jgi:hypothetical protein